MNFITSRFKISLKLNAKLINVIILVSSFVLIFILLLDTYIRKDYDYQIGSVVPENIILTKDVIDSEETLYLKETAIRNTSPEMTIDFSKLVEVRRDLTDFFSTLHKLRDEYPDNLIMRKSVVTGVFSDNIYALNEEQLRKIAILEEEDITSLENYAIDITSENMTNGISSDDIVGVFDAVEKYIDSIDDFSENERTILKKIVFSAITPNEFIDLEKTTIKQQEAAANIEDVVYKKGTTILYAGDLVTDQTYNLLYKADMISENNQSNWVTISGIGILLSSVWILMHIILWTRDVNTPQRYGLFMTIFITSFLITPFFKTISIYTIPVPMYAILTSMMIGSQYVLPTGFFLVVILSLWHGFNINVSSMFILCLILTPILTKRIKLRFQLVMNGFYVALAMNLYYLGSVMINGSDLKEVPMHIVYIMASGIISGILSIGIMPMLETIFQVLTPFKLLELSNPNRDILKQLMLEAPGTYHHSILVGNLAETAAHAIGANSVLTRVASFYHDIGKLEKPYYFKENQMGMDNPHDKLPPQISANILKQHVAYGLILSQKNKLPREINAIIEEHHGTTTIQFFYHSAKQKNPDADISPFKYDGPKPKSKESVIVMLADSVEAAVRSLENPTKTSVHALIDKIVAQKIFEDQFSESDITLHELKCIKESFERVINGIFHERIAYPEQIEQ